MFFDESAIFFLLQCTFLVPSLKNTTPIFPDIFLIDCFTVFSGTINLHNAKSRYLQNERKYSKKENAILI